MGFFGGIGVMLVQVVFGLLLFVMVLRVVLPLSGARFRNPLCQLIYRVTNPVLAPLGKVIPNFRRLSISAVLLTWLIATLGAGALWLLSGETPPLLGLLLLGLGIMIHFILGLYFWAVVVRAVMSFFSPDYGNPAVELLHDLTEPLLKPFRRLPPRMSGVDLSPLWACVAIRIVGYTLNYIGLSGFPL
jgi:YggT family protein